MLILLLPKKVLVAYHMQTDYSQMKLRFHAYVRLIGTVYIYFKKNLSKLEFETPNQLLNSIDPILNYEEKHTKWYQSIKTVIHIARYIDDLLSLNDTLFINEIPNIYPQELVLNRTSESDMNVIFRY